MLKVYFESGGQEGSNGCSIWGTIILLLTLLLIPSNAFGKKNL